MWVSACCQYFTGVENSCMNFQDNTYKNTPFISLCNKTTWCKVVKVYDGDTITCVIPFKSTRYKFRCRLAGIDAAEIKTTNTREKKIAIEARDWLSGLILDKNIIITCGKFDKYQRVLVTVYKNKWDFNHGKSMNDELVEKKYAYIYGGGTKQSNYF